MRLRVLPVLILAACSDPIGPRLPDGAVQLQHDSRFFTAWKEVEECSGRTRDHSEVRWYVVPNAESVPLGDEMFVWGMYERRTSAIIIAGKHAANIDLLRHEILHALLEQSGHPDEFFKYRCGPIVTVWGNAVPIGNDTLR